ERDGGERARDDLAVDRVGDHEPAAVLGADEAEVEDVTDVVLGHGGESGPRQDRLDDPADARFAETLGEAVEVGILAADEPLLGGFDVRLRDRLGRVGYELLDGL